MPTPFVRPVVTWAMFLDAVRAAGLWKLSPNGEIERESDNPDCPWMAVGTVMQRTRYLIDDGELVTARDIFAAADNAPGHNPKIRRGLLRACGLADTDSRTENQETTP